MNRKMKIKIIIDVLMTISLLFLMAYGLVGEKAHEWIGMGMFILFVLHHILNEKWLGNIRRGQYNFFRVLQTILVIILLILMIGSMISGILLSNYIFKFLNIEGIANIARNVHIFCAYWGFILMSIHLGIHWNSIIKMIGKLFPFPSVLQKLCAQILAVIVTVYGVYSFKKRNIGKYMFMKMHFVFFDYQESMLFFILDYIAIMVLFIFVGHYFCKGLKKFCDRRA